MLGEEGRQYVAEGDVVAPDEAEGYEVEDEVAIFGERCYVFPNALMGKVSGDECQLTWRRIRLFLKADNKKYAPEGEKPVLCKHYLLEALEALALTLHINVG